VAVARAFTPRFQVVGPVVLLDVGGLSRLFGSAQEIGQLLIAQAAHGGSLQGSLTKVPHEGPHGGAHVAVAIAPTATAATLLALSRSGLTVIPRGDEPAALAPLPVGVLGEFERIRLARPENGAGAGAEYRTPITEHRSSGWSHPRTTHPAQQAKRLLKRQQEALAQGLDHLRTLKRWGIHTLGDLAALPAPEMFERLGARGVAWQHLARGEDDGPLVPWVDEAPFAMAMDLEWPLEGLEPLSFALARLLEPLAARLEQADRGAAVLHTALRLTTRTTHVRSLQLPAPMRDPKTLRTLMLLDLETHPPDAAVDRVSVLIEPTPARVLQWTLYDRAEPAPEQVSTLLARLSALMGEGHVGSPRLADTWRPGAFEMAAFSPGAGNPLDSTGRSAGVARDRRPAFARLSVDAELRRVRHSGPSGRDGGEPGSGKHVSPGTGMLALKCALRRFRMPVPVRVKVEEGRPVRVTTDRHGVTGGAITQSAGPWRTSGSWWLVGQVGLAGQSFDPPHPPHHAHQPWDRDEWDIAMTDGTVYRLAVEREVGQWFLEGIVD
jgi:protein ImuB